MAEEAFALSPISARASLPGEGDYAAIREAFMETARGRWFLSEYARRNRNADTTMVLDAVSRMEATLAARKQSPSVGLTESLGAIRAAIRAAKVSAAEAMPRTDDDGELLAASNGARIIREIAWTLRECGADTRICDLLDTHVKAVEIGQQRIADLNSRSTVLASFDALVLTIEQISTGTPPQAAPTAPQADIAPEASAEKASVDKQEASVTPLFRTETAAEPEAATAPTHTTSTPATQHAEQDISQTGIEETIAGSETADTRVAMSEAEVASEEAAATDIAMTPLDAEDVQDQAVLDMIAMEMAAPDFGEPDAVVSETDAAKPVAEVAALPDIDAPTITAPAPAEPGQALATTQAVAATPLAPTPVVPEPAVPTPVALIVAHEVLVQTPQPPSLGAALIAGGVVPNPGAPVNDLLAPIRRMTQAEKIAFFS